MSEPVTKPRPGTRANGTSPVGQIVGALVFMAVGWGAMLLFLGAFSPKEYEPPVKPFTGYDVAAMAQAVTPEAVRVDLDQILSYGNRFIGQPGHRRTAELIHQRYTEAGLEIFEQEFETVAPVTHRNELLVGDRTLTVYPFMPNQMQPQNTPPEGVSGRLVRATDELLLNGQDFQRLIPVVDLSRPLPDNYSTQWLKYAQLGCPAVIVAHAEGLGEAEWTSLARSMVSPNPVNYPRLAAGPEIFEVLDQDVTIHVRTRYEQITNRTLVGRLRAGAEGSTSARGAIVVPCSYDASSPLPDLAPGTLQAVPVATHLALLRGLLPYREQLRRDVVFVAFGSRVMAQDGLHRLLATIGPKNKGEQRLAELTEDVAEDTALLATVEPLPALFDEAEFMADPQATMRLLGPLTAESRALLDDQLLYVLNTQVFLRSEAMLDTKIVFEKLPEQDLDSPEYAAYLEAKKHYDKAFSAAGFRVQKLLEEQAEYVASAGIRRLLHERLRELLDYHRLRLRRRETNLKLHRMFREYADLVSMDACLLPTEKPAATSTITYSIGSADARLENPVIFRNHLLSTARHLDLADQVRIRFHGRFHSNKASQATASVPLEANTWAKFSYPSFTIVNADRTKSYQHFYDPIEAPWMRDVQTMERSLSLAGQSILSAAFGNSEYSDLVAVEQMPTYHGNVYVSNVGQSIIPNYPLPNALVATSGPNWAPDTHFRFMIIPTDPYGYYEYPYLAGDFVDGAIYSPDAYSYDANGVIDLIKDTGSAAQFVYRSVNVSNDAAARPVNLVMFRCAPVSILDLINPQTLKAYAGARFVRRRGLTAFTNTNSNRHGGIVTAFIPPQEYFYVQLMAGAVESETTQTTRAFMLGTPLEQALTTEPDATVRAGKEVAGNGYLAQDTRLLLDPPVEIAKSMIDVNGKRLAVQNQGGYQMADERTREFQERSEDLLAQSQDEQLSWHRATLEARSAVTYATLNHPVLRRNIWEAIIGIIWYLGLLVPFVFFFEKLAFGFTDIRKQLIAHLIIFLVVFALLKFLHPAFSMIRSSLMILLGFIIMLISASITVLFGSKFRENLEEIRRRQGRVTAAEVNTMGVVATAFLLGLNNMHRRRVRTGLTCTTLVLLTFVMICFTSVQSDLVDMQQAIGKSPYSGFLVKNEHFKPVTGAELSALHEKYGTRFAVTPRYMYVGREDWHTRDRFNPKVDIVRDLEDGKTRGVELKSLLRFSWEEPLRHSIPLLTQRGWFTEEIEEATEGLRPIIISDKSAEELRITPEMVDNSEVVVKLRGVEVRVWGIFDSGAVDDLQGLDSLNLMPFDILGLRVLNKEGENILAEPTDPRIHAADIVIGPLGSWPIARDAISTTEIINSIAVSFPDRLDYKESRSVIDEYLEQSGKPTYYGLDGYAFLGQRARDTSIKGLVDLLIPLIIAALTVLNTMKGSVYERKDEIFVYNAVGIAPKYIFSMFFAEAIVYAVVGSVLGYLLSQGTGRALIGIDMTGGMNMTFTSLSTIYASLTIVVSVFLATYFPAKTASEIAAPTTDLGWSLPEPQGDDLRFHVPFTFDYRDRVAILEFFDRWFQDHGEGGIGTFSASVPVLTISDQLDPLDEQGYIPELRVTTWLKPFDLGVSQELYLTLGKDPETGEYIPTVTLRRLSGTIDQWKLLNERFVAQLRKQFLHWRAVSEPEKQEMFETASRKMREEVPV